MKYKFFNTLIISLILILLLNSGFYILLYLSSIKFVKKTVYYLLEKDQLNKELIILSFSREDIKNLKVAFQRIDEKEFRFNGDMYDIKQDLSDKDSLRFLCYLDIHENLLEKLFSKYTDRKKDRDSNQPQKITLIPFLGLYFQTSEKLKLFSEYYLFSPEIHSIFTNFYKDILTPPPQSEFYLI